MTLDLDALEKEAKYMIENTMSSGVRDSAHHRILALISELRHLLRDNKKLHFDLAKTTVRLQSAEEALKELDPGMTYEAVK